jgi:hypothetical protein
LEDVAMNAIAKTVTTLLVAGAMLLPQGVNGTSLVRTRAPDALDFEKYLPTLPADVPWLVPNRPALARNVLPEAGSVNALMLSLQPVEGWGTLTSQPAALRLSAGCGKC